MNSASRQYTGQSTREQPILKAISLSPLSVFYQNTALVYTWVENPPDGWTGGDMIGRSDEDLLPRATAELLVAAKHRAIKSRSPQSTEYCVRRNGTERWFDAVIQPDLDDRGVLRGIISSVLEITEQKQKEIVLGSLLREVSHRSKNLLAMVIAIASHTSRNSTSVPGFLKSFSGRLQSLARSQDVITKSEWRGATVEEVLDRQVFQPFPQLRQRLQFSGPNVALNPNGALHVGMAFHELATNALTYGALSNNSGKVEVSTTRNAPEDAQGLTIAWHESGGPAISEAIQKRFGSTTLERVVPAAVDGEGTLEFRAEGIEYRLSISQSALAS